MESDAFDKKSSRLDWVRDWYWKEQLEWGVNQNGNGNGNGYSYGCWKLSYG